ncbi:unnamed protein product [Closterium sp. Yama58-4]|nr:unnamed protein product [Closterium sp. Yama58-4]
MSVTVYVIVLWLRRKDSEEIAKELIVRAKASLRGATPADVAAGVAQLSAAVDRAPWLAGSLQEIRARALMRLQRYEEVVAVLAEYLPDLSTVHNAMHYSEFVGGYRRWCREESALMRLQRYEELVAVLADYQPDFSSVHNAMHYTEDENKSATDMWQCLLLGQATYHLGWLDEALVLLRRAKRLSQAVARKESALMDEDQFPVFDASHPAATAPLSASSSAGETLNRLILVIRFLLWRRSAGDAAFAAGLYLEAVRHYSKVLESKKGIPQSLAASLFLRRAAAFQASSRIADAIADCSRASALEPHRADALWCRACLYQSVGCFQEASQDLERLLSFYQELLASAGGGRDLWLRSARLGAGDTGLVAALELGLGGEKRKFVGRQRGLRRWFANAVVHVGRWFVALGRVLGVVAQEEEDEAGWWREQTNMEVAEKHLTWEHVRRQQEQREQQREQREQQREALREGLAASLALAAYRIALIRNSEARALTFVEKCAIRDGRSPEEVKDEVMHEWARLDGVLQEAYAQLIQATGGNKDSAAAAAAALQVHDLDDLDDLDGEDGEGEGDGDEDGGAEWGEGEGEGEGGDVEGRMRRRGERRKLFGRRLPGTPSFNLRRGGDEMDVGRMLRGKSRVWERGSGKRAGREDMEGKGEGGDWWRKGRRDKKMRDERGWREREERREREGDSMGMSPKLHSFRMERWVEEGASMDGMRLDSFDFGVVGDVFGGLGSRMKIWKKKEGVRAGGREKEGREEEKEEKGEKGREKEREKEKERRRRKKLGVGDLLGEEEDDEVEQRSRFGFGVLAWEREKDKEREREKERERMEREREKAEREREKEKERAEREREKERERAEREKEKAEKEREKQERKGREREEREERRERERAVKKEKERERRERRERRKKLQGSAEDLAGEFKEEAEGKESVREKEGDRPDTAGAVVQRAGEGGGGRESRVAGRVASMGRESDSEGEYEREQWHPGGGDYNEGADSFVDSLGGVEEEGEGGQAERLLGSEVVEQGFALRADQGRAERVGEAGGDQEKQGMENSAAAAGGAGGGAPLAATSAAGTVAAAAAAAAAGAHMQSGELAGLGAAVTPFSAESMAGLTGEGSTIGAVANPEIFLKPGLLALATGAGRGGFGVGLLHEQGGRVKERERDSSPPKPSPHRGNIFSVPGIRLRKDPNRERDKEREGGGKGEGGREGVPPHTDHFGAVTAAGAPGASPGGFSGEFNAIMSPTTPTEPHSSHPHSLAPPLPEVEEGDEEGAIGEEGEEGEECGEGEGGEAATPSAVEGRGAKKMVAHAVLGGLKKGLRTGSQLGKKIAAATMSPQR